MDDKKFLDKVVDRLLKESKYRLWEDKNITNISKYSLKKIRVEIIFALRGNNTWPEYPIEVYTMKMVHDNLTKQPRKSEYLEDYEEDHLTNIYGLNSDEIMVVIHKYYNLLYNNIYSSYLEMNEDDKVPTNKPEEWFRGDEVFEIGGGLNESLSSRVNKDVDDLFSTNKNLTNEKKVKSIFMDKYGMNKQDADQAMIIYLSKQQSLNESDRQGRYLDKVVERLVSETHIDVGDGSLYAPGNTHITKTRGSQFVAKQAFNPEFPSYNRLFSHILHHCRDIYGLTDQEINYVWNQYFDEIESNYNYLKSLNESTEDTLREQHYEDWDERSREQNINLLKAKGIEILSTDTNVPFYKRIDSKEIRFLKKIADRLDKESKIEVVGEAIHDDDFLLLTPFGKFQYFDFINEISLFRFEKYVDDLYAVGENQIMFPTHNSIAQTRESVFLWEMYKDKLKRKYLKLVNPGLDIPDDAIITERHQYDTWREKHLNYGEEQNKEIFKDKGITVLSTDINVPFYKRIDSKEIRFLNNVANRMDEQTKIEIEGPTWIPRTIHHNVLHRDVRVDPSYYRKMNTITFATTPFGKFQLAVLLEDEKRKFKKYVDNAYAVGDNQIMFPAGNNITQTTEIDFLWAMYTDKLKRKHLKLINPDLDIPDDDFIREKEYQEKWSDWRNSITESTQDLSDEELKSLDSSFENMGMPPEMAAEELGDLITWVKTLPEELFLYRVIYLDDKNQLNYDELGSHYSQDRTDLINNHYNRGSIYGHKQGEDAYLITVKVPKSEVDIMETLNNNILYPNEEEITLKNKGKGATYLDIEKI